MRDVMGSQPPPLGQLELNSNCDLVNESLVTSEKAASFSLRHLTLSIVLFLLARVSFWNSGGENAAYI